MAIPENLVAEAKSYPFSSTAVIHEGLVDSHPTLGPVLRLALDTMAEALTQMTDDELIERYIEVRADLRRTHQALTPYMLSDDPRSAPTNMMAAFAQASMVLRITAVELIARAEGPVVEE